MDNLDSNMSLELKLSALEKITRAATQGPWHGDINGTKYDIFSDDCDFIIANCKQDDELTWESWWNNMHYISTFNPEMVLKLIKAIKLLATQRDYWASVVTCVPVYKLKLENDDKEIEAVLK